MKKENRISQKKLADEMRTLEFETIRLQKQLVETMGNVVTERPTDGGWSSVLLDPARKGLVITDQLTMIMQARRMFMYDFNARAAIWSFVKYIMGRGFAIKPKSKDPKVRYIWREFWSSDRNKMGTRKYEIVMRAFRDGEVLLQWFGGIDEINGRTYKSTVRFIDPLSVKNPASKANNLDPNVSSGIECDPEDVERALYYWVHNPWNESDVNKISADEILHIKLFADSDQRRGTTHILPIMRLITHYQQWLENRIILNKVRSAVVLVRKITGNSADVSRIAGSLGTAGVVRNNETKSNMIRGGTILNANDGVDYEFKSPNINAGDVKDDGRAMVTRMAGSTGLPEYMFGDASNSNYASSMVSESPFVKEIEYWQGFFEEAWIRPMFKRVIQAAVDAGVLQAPKDEDVLAQLNGDAIVAEAKGKEPPTTEDDEPDEETEMEKFFGCDVQWPEIIHRDIKEQVDALTLAREQGWISDATASEVLGYDPNEEFRKQADWQAKLEKDGNPWAVTSADPQDAEDASGVAQADKELNTVLRNISPELRKQIMAAKTPQDVMTAIGMNDQSGKGGKPGA